MLYAAADLQKAIYQALANSSQLELLLGGKQIFDHNPTRAKFPYIVLGQATSADWSTSTEDGNEHLITVHVWSKEHDRDEIHAIQQQVLEALDNIPPQLVDHHLVNLTLEFSEIRHDVQSSHLHGIMRYRAVTEPQT